MVITMLTNLGRRMDVHSENFNKELGKIRKCHIEVTEMTEKYTRRVPQQTRCRRKDQSTQRQVSKTPNQRSKKKIRGMKKS